MAAISVGDALGAGFSLIGRRPLAVLAWGAANVAAFACAWAVLLPVWLSMIAEFPRAEQTPGPPGPAQLGRMLSHMAMAQGAGGLVSMLQLAVGAVLTCAVTRAIVRPQERAWAYMRLGAPELFVAVLVIAAGFVLAFGFIALAIPTLIAIAILVATHHAAFAVAAAALAALAAIAALAYCALRLSIVPAMMVSDGQFHLFDAWTVTRGAVGALFLVGLCLVLIAWAMELVLLIAGLVIVAMTIHMPAGGQEALRAIAEQGPGPLLARAAPALIAMAVVGVFVLGALRAIMVAPWARAFLDLKSAPASPGAAPSAPPTATSPAPSLSGV